MNIKKIGKFGKKIIKKFTREFTRELTREVHVKFTREVASRVKSRVKRELHVNLTWSSREIFTHGAGTVVFGLNYFENMEMKKGMITMCVHM